MEAAPLLTFQCNNVFNIFTQRRVLSADPVCKKLFSDLPSFPHYSARNIWDYIVRTDTYVQHVPIQSSLDGVTGFFQCSNYSEL